jgi:hypothetical protein
VSLHLWAAEAEDPLPVFPDQPDAVDMVESTEPSSTDVQLSSKLDETSSVKASTLENSSIDSAQVPATKNVESTEPSSTESDRSAKLSTMEDGSTDSAQVPAPNSGSSIVESRLSPEEEPAARDEPVESNSVLSSQEPVIEGDPMLDQISDKHCDDVAGTSDPSSVACSDTLDVLKESSPESCQEDTSNDAIDEHDNGKDAAYHKYGLPSTQPVDESDDAASDYEPGEAQPYDVEAGFQGFESMAFETMPSFDWPPPQERTRNDRNDASSTFPMTQPDAENEIFRHVPLDLEEEAVILPISHRDNILHSSSESLE